jgi:hypothetical protein
MKKITAMKLALGMGAGLALGVCQPANAANWFNIQTISLPEWGSGQFIGFLQPLYTDIAPSPTNVIGYPKAPANGQTANFDMVGPQYYSDSQLYMQRARLFIRGSIGGNPDISYYVGAEAGQNAYDYSFGRYAPRIMDANVVFSHYIPGVRLEIGNIRAPGPEAAMEGFMDFNFLDQFASGIAQLMQPTFYNNSMHYAAGGTALTGGAQTRGGYVVPGADVSGNNAFRYPGIQAEDWFMVAPKVEVAYGAMLADYGRLLDTGTSNGPIVAGRLQASYLYGSEQGRFFRNDLTGFIWAQAAHPQINGTSNSMTRDGFGMTYRKGYMEHGGLDVKAEYFEGSGNIAAPTIFNETPGMYAANAPQLYDEIVYAGSNNTAHGYDISTGYFLTKRIEAVLRYDYYDRLPNNAVAERVFADTSFAIQYHVTPLTRVVVDYIDRSLTIPNPGAVSAASGAAVLAQASAIANSMGNQMDIWAVYAF